MITEDFVSFEVARLLKDKGFNIGVRHYYQKIDDDVTYHIGGFTNWNVYDMWYSMPTLQMAMKWLREEKELLISILPTIDKDGYACLMYYLWDLADIYKDAIKSGLYSVESYEECVDDAIKKCMELI